MPIELIIYLIDISDNLSCGLTLLLVISFTMTLVIVFFMLTEDIFPISVVIKKVRNYCWIWFLFLLINFCIPSQKAMYLMLGAHSLKQSDVPSKIEAVINKKIDEYLIESKKEGEKK